MIVVAGRPGTGRSFDTLDLLRGVAAGCILAWHFVPLGGKDWWSAYLAVDLFFMMSGVVIAHAYESRLRAGWAPWRFLLTRIVRLWPLYLLGTAVGAAAMAGDILAAWGPHPWRFRSVEGDIVLAVPMLPHLVPPTGPIFPLNRNAWSLLCEMIVNIGYGFGGFRLSNRVLAAVTLAGAAIVGWGAFHFADSDSALNLGGLAIHLGVGIGRALFSFPLGVLAYRWWRAGALPRIPAPPAMLSLGFLALLVVVPGEGRYAPLASCLAIWFALPLLVVSAMQSEPRGLMRSISRWGGAFSYPLYVLQDGFYLVAATLAARHLLMPWPAYGLAAVATVACTPVADRLFDRPIRARLTRLFGLGSVRGASPPAL